MKLEGRSFSTTRAGISFAGERRWWGNQWTLRAASTAPYSETLYISVHGSDRGYWRDMVSGRAELDREHFIFCDTPAVLRLIVGDALDHALNVQRAEPITLYMRDGVIRTSGALRGDDVERVMLAHEAIHRAVATDQTAFLTRWVAHVASAQGRGNMTWPPSGSINSRVGTLIVGLSWELPPETTDGADWDRSYNSLRTDLVAHGDREKPRWTFEAVPEHLPATHIVDGTRYRASGAVPFERIAPLIERARPSSLTFGSRLVVSLPGMARGPQIAAGVALIESLLRATSASQSPYR